MQHTFGPPETSKQTINLLRICDLKLIYKYIGRSIDVQNVPASARKAMWVDRVQGVLTELYTQEHSAAYRDAVDLIFYLLQNVVHGRSAKYAWCTGEIRDISSDTDWSSVVPLNYSLVASHLQHRHQRYSHMARRGRYAERSITPEEPAVQLGESHSQETAGAVDDHNELLQDQPLEVQDTPELAESAVADDVPPPASSSTRRIEDVFGFSLTGSFMVNDVISLRDKSRILKRDPGGLQHMRLRLNITPGVFRLLSESSAGTSGPDYRAYLYMCEDVPAVPRQAGPGQNATTVQSYVVRYPPNFKIMANNGRDEIVMTSTEPVSRPLDISSLLIADTGNRKVLNLSFTSDVNWFTCVALVQVHSTQSAIATIFNRQLAGRARTFAAFQTMINTRTARTGSEFRLNMLCPITGRRIKNPIRSANCDHYTCFEASAFLEHVEEQTCVQCPICQAPIDSWRDLVYDEMMEALQVQTGMELKEILLGGNGHHTNDADASQVRSVGTESTRGGQGSLSAEPAVAASEMSIPVESIPDQADNLSRAFSDLSISDCTGKNVVVGEDGTFCAYIASNIPGQPPKLVRFRIRIGDEECAPAELPQQ